MGYDLGTVKVRIVREKELFLGDLLRAIYCAKCVYKTARLRRSMIVKSRHHHRRDLPGHRG